MYFCVLNANKLHKDVTPKFIEVENISRKSIENFKNSVSKSNVFSKLDNNLNSDPNANYTILSNILTNSKRRHIPKKQQKFNKRRDKKENWMTNDLLKLVTQKNTMYRSWKATQDLNEYNVKKINFKTFEKIVDQSKTEAKHNYYYNTFMSLSIMT